MHTVHTTVHKVQGTVNAVSHETGVSRLLPPHSAKQSDASRLLIEHSESYAEELRAHPKKIALMVQLVDEGKAEIFPVSHTFKRPVRRKRKEHSEGSIGSNTEGKSPFTEGESPFTEGKSPFTEGKSPLAGSSFVKEDEGLITSPHGATKPGH